MLTRRTVLKALGTLAAVPLLRPLAALANHQRSSDAAPLQWILDLDLSRDETRAVAGQMIDLPHRCTTQALPYSTLAEHLRGKVAWAEQVNAQRPLLPESLTMFRKVITPAADKCDALGEQQMSLRGIYFASKPLMEGEKAALRKLTSDPRILERLGI